MVFFSENFKKLQEKLNKTQFFGTKKNFKHKVSPVPTRAITEEASSSKQLPQLTNVIALDCEFVGDAEGFDLLARVSIVDSNRQVMYDKYVKPSEKICDYRTHVSGIRPEHLVNGEPFEKVRDEVSKIITGKLVVGHSLESDFRVLKLKRNDYSIFDTALNYHLHELAYYHDSYYYTPSLKLLAWRILNVSIQRGEHDSIVDAQTALDLYLYNKKACEKLNRAEKIKQ